MSTDGSVVVRPAPGALAPGHHHHHHHHHHHPHAHHHHHHHHSHAPRKLQTESLTFCGNCEKPGDGNTRLLRCQACHNAVYCNAECQKAHWPAHKMDCKRLQGIYASMPPEVAERQKRLNSWMRQRIALFKQAGFAAVLFPSTPSAEQSAISTADSETSKTAEATPQSAESSPAAEEANAESESAGALTKPEAEANSEPEKPKPTTIDTHFLAVTVTPFTSTTGSLSFEVADADVGEWDKVPELWVTANVREQQAELIASAARKAAEDAEKKGTEQRTVRGILWVLVICDMVPHLHPIIVWEDEAEKEKARKEARENEEDWEQRLKDGCKLGSGHPKSPSSDEGEAAA